MPADSIELKRSVLVTAIMTPAFRQQLIVEARESIRRLDESLALVSEALASASEASSGAAQALLEEQSRLTRQKGEVEWRVREIEGVADEAEMPFRTIESTVQVRVGDDFLLRMAQAEVVLRDWKVVEIRKP